jgi:hypothetical protein
MKKEISDEQLYTTIEGIKKQLAKPLSKLGKVSLQKGTSLDRAIRVRTPLGSHLNVVVRHEHSGGFSCKPTGLYAVLVQEVRTADSRIKYRARDFTGLAPKLTEKQVTDIVACVQKHLVAQNERTRDVDARIAESEHSEKEKAAREAGLRATLERHGIKAGELSIYCEGATFNVRLRLEEDELEQFLKFWKTRDRGSPVPQGRRRAELPSRAKKATK